MSREILFGIRHITILALPPLSIALYSFFFKIIFKDYLTAKYISLIPAFPHTAPHLHTTHLHESQQPKQSDSHSHTPTHTTSVSLVLGLAWSWAASTPSPTPLPVLLIPAVPANRDAEITDLEYLLARMSAAQVPAMAGGKGGDTGAAGAVGELKMSLQHYNVDPRLISSDMREILWPSLVLQVSVSILIYFVLT